MIPTIKNLLIGIKRQGFSNTYHILKNNLLVYFRKGIVGDWIRIETSTLCQLNCPCCIQASGDLGIFGKGYLTFDNFKEFVDTYPNFSNIEISNNGEIFLNPDIDRIIEYAFKKNITLEAFNGVNLNTVKESTLENLVKYRFRVLSVSIDGASSNTYSIYRQGGSFNQAIENIKKINEFKENYHSHLPILVWQMIPFSHNEHEIDKAKKMAASLKMDFVVRLNLNPEYAPIKSSEPVRNKAEVKASSLSNFEEIHEEAYNLTSCGQLWAVPQINWDGKLLGCCMNKFSDYGNVFELGLEKCLFGEKYQYAKQMLLGREKPREDIPCTECPVFKAMNASPEKKAASIKKLEEFHKQYKMSFSQMLKDTAVKLLNKEQENEIL